MKLGTNILRVVHGTKVLGSGILNFGTLHAPRGATPNLARSGEITHHSATGVLILFRAN